LVLAAVAGLPAMIGTLSTTLVYRKDLFQDYLAALAGRDGGDPYQPMAVLRDANLGEVLGTQEFPHPTPHPPPAILLTLPLCRLTYPRAAACWLAMASLLGGLCAVLVMRGVWGETGAGPPAALAALALLTPPVRDDL